MRAPGFRFPLSAPGRDPRVGACTTRWQTRVDKLPDWGSSSVACCCGSTVFCSLHHCQPLHDRCLLACLGGFVCPVDSTRLGLSISLHHCVRPSHLLDEGFPFSLCLVLFLALLGLVLLTPSIIPFHCSVGTRDYFSCRAVAVCTDIRHAVYLHNATLAPQPAEMSASPVKRRVLGALDPNACSSPKVGTDVKPLWSGKSPVKSPRTGAPRQTGAGPELSSRTSEREAEVRKRRSPSLGMPSRGEGLGEGEPAAKRPCLEDDAGEEVRDQVWFHGVHSPCCWRRLMLTLYLPSPVPALLNVHSQNHRHHGPPPLRFPGLALRVRHLGSRQLSSHHPHRARRHRTCTGTHHSSTAAASTGSADA